MPGKVVILTGLIGSGKTTLSQELAAQLGEDTLWMSEPDEKEGRNPYLSDYYKDGKRWSLTMQVHLLQTRFRQHLEAQWATMNSNRYAVLDSSYWQDTAFARLQLKMGLMDEREFQTYAGLYHAMTAHVLLPTVCVRLVVDPEIAAERIARRMEIQTGRKCENVIDLQYLKNLDAEIEAVSKTLQSMGVCLIEVPWNEVRETPADRAGVIWGIARAVRTYKTHNSFLDLHRRMV